MTSFFTAKPVLAPGQIHFTTLPPLSLYVHFPWCIRKCPYCDFNSHTWQEKGTQTIHFGKNLPTNENASPSSAPNFPEDAYLDALRADLEHALPLIWGRTVHSIFIGGGTPSLLSAAGVDRLLSDIRARVPLEPTAEITLEANPSTFEAEKFSQFRASGINRLSVGVQSFDDAKLAALGRTHNAEEAHEALSCAKRIFKNFNLDLMFGLPGQSMEECKKEVERALSYDSPHLSLYHLTIEPNTWFAKYPPPVPDDELCADMQAWIPIRLAQSGYQNYEISAYAKPGQTCKHNLNYWRFGDYLGIGAGAHSKLSFSNKIVRQVRHKQPIAYMDHCKAGLPIQEEHEVKSTELAFEFMLNILRLGEGFAPHFFTERTGLPLSIINTKLDLAESRGLLTRTHQHIAPSPLGYRFLNDLQALFLEE